MITPLTIMIVGFLGAVTFKLINYSATGKKNIDSPINFDIKYWLADRGNWNDLLLGAILFAILATYKEDIFKIYPEMWLVKAIAPFSNSWLFYFILGLLMTYIIKIFRNLIWMVGKLSNTTFKNKEKQLVSPLEA
jgi:hypothetical protein